VAPEPKLSSVDYAMNRLALDRSSMREALMMIKKSIQSTSST
jgi:hypothetical protein